MPRLTRSANAPEDRGNRDDDGDYAKRVDQRRAFGPHLRERPVLYFRPIGEGSPVRFREYLHGQEVGGKCDRDRDRSRGRPEDPSRKTSLYLGHEPNLRHGVARWLL